MAVKPRDLREPDEGAGRFTRRNLFPVWARARKARDASAWVDMTRLGYLRGTCERLRSHLSSLWLDAAIVTLTLLSALAVTGEILVRFGILRAPSGTCLGSGQTQHSTHALDSGGGAVTTAEPSEGPADDIQTMELVLKIFHYISLAVAAIFLAEIVLKMAAFRLKFLMNHWQVLDMLIVFATAVVEVAFEVGTTTPEVEAATYIVVFRLWRLPHTCNIKANAVQRSLEQEIEVWKAGKVKLDDKCNNLEMKNNRQKERMDRLERELLLLRGRLTDTKLSTTSSPTAHFKNAKAPLDGGDGFVNNRLEFRQSSPPAHLQRQAFTTAREGLAESKKAPEDDERSEPEDREETEKAGYGRGRYFRSGSESSLSCQAVEHEVRVQIEDGQRECAESAAYTSSPESPLPVCPQQLQQESSRGQPDDTSSSMTADVHQVLGKEYDNRGFRWEDEDGEPEIHGVLVHEIDGVKTYRSADGIPMTSL